MFKIIENNSYFWPAKIRYPDNGSFKEHTVTIKLKHLSYDEERALAQVSADALKGFNEETKIEKMGELADYTDHIIESVFLGWKEGEIKDSQGNSLEDNTENISLMLKNTAFRQAILEARRASQSAGKSAI